MEYVCPMHPKVQSDNKGRCPKCGMELVLKQNNRAIEKQKPEKDSYAPLLIIIGLIILVSATITFKDIQVGVFALQKSLTYFMSGFFLVFGAFKLVDLKGFAQEYSTYDLLAKRLFAYGYVYPLIELAFGLGTILYPQSKLILSLELIIMSFSGLGVAIKIAKKEKFRCVCLGTFLKVPLTKVTLIEDFGMAILALVLLMMK